MNDAARQSGSIESNMGISPEITRGQRLTRSEAIERTARFNLVGIYLIGAGDGNDFRLKAQTILRARLIPDEWAVALEAHGVAIWHRNRAIHRIFAEAGYARRTYDLLDTGFASEEAFATRARELGLKVLSAEDQDRLLGCLMMHSDALKRALEFAEYFLMDPRPGTPTFDTIPEPFGEGPEARSQRSRQPEVAVAS